MKRILLLSSLILCSFSLLFSQSLQQIIAPTSISPTDQFGYAVDISGNFLIAGAPGGPANFGPNSNQGKAYIYQKDLTGQWQEAQTLTLADCNCFPLGVDPNAPTTKSYIIGNFGNAVTINQDLA
ncbi:MAG: FG-GAP repeat protein, partial [Bacteroidota bacterium]